jgi:hypothetical protein
MKCVHNLDSTSAWNFYLTWMECFRQVPSSTVSDDNFTSSWYTSSVADSGFSCATISTSPFSLSGVTFPVGLAKIWGSGTERFVGFRKNIRYSRSFEAFPPRIAYPSSLPFMISQNGWYAAYMQTTGKSKSSHYSSLI